MSWEPTDLERIFGVAAGSPRQSAVASKRQYIRSLDQLAEYRGRGRGRRLTALEALDAYGMEVLSAVADDGSAPLCSGAHAAGDVLLERMTDLGLEPRQVGALAGVAEERVKAALGSRRLPIRDYERVGRVLALDERFLSVVDEPRGNRRVALRLRKVGKTQAALTPRAVASLSEAAWVAGTQRRLEGQLGVARSLPAQFQNPSYGTPGFPAHRWGFFLAQQVREGLGLSSASIPSLRALAEDTLGIPLIQTELGPDVAGAAIEVGESRAIVVNISGRNRHAYTRRATVAHELGHLLCDPAGRLSTLRVDSYSELESRAELLHDEVEQRANAFGVELLFPQAAAVALHASGIPDPVGSAMHKFDIGFTAARYQIWNGLERSVPLDSLTTRERRPLDEWEAAERFTVDYHPVRNIKPSRAGRFSAVVVLALERGLISDDTAREYLEADADELAFARELLPSLHPRLFART